MKWNNAQKDELPYDGQSVLISVEGIYYICRYRNKDRVFTVNDAARSSFLVDNELIYWTEF